MTDPAQAHPPLAFVSLGANLGDPVVQILEALERLETHSVRPLLRSSLWQSTPVDCPPGSPPFVNAVAGLAPFEAETPESLLDKLQALETQFGRRPKQVLNEPRPLDLDLIAFGLETRATPRLMLPHPRAHQRRFVLEPLSEIAPELVLPGQSVSIAGLLAAYRGPEQLHRLSAPPGVGPNWLRPTPHQGSSAR